MIRINPVGTAGPAAADRRRYAAALAAAADPEMVFTPVLQTFKRLTVAMRGGDREAAAIAARDLELHCLQLCVVPAASAVAADDRQRVAAIIMGWAWPRRPALAAVLDRNAAQEARRWGGEVAGEA